MAAYFLRLLRCFFLVMRYFDLASGLYYLFIFFNVLDMKMHTYFLTITWQALRGCEPPNLLEGGEEGRFGPSPFWVVLTPTLAPSGSGFQLGPFHFFLPSGGKTGWRNSYQKSINYTSISCLKKNKQTSILINGLCHHYVSTLSGF